MSKTKFPKPSIYHLDMDVDPPRKTKPAAYDYNAINDWIKRCIKEYPNGHYQPEPDDWFDKWFSQFRDFTLQKGCN